MTWLFFALLAALLVTFSSIAEKKALLKEHAMQFSVVLALINLAFSIPLFFMIDYSTIQLSALVLLFIASIFGASAYVLVAKALRHMELSSAVPFFVLGPLFTVFLAWIFLGEALSLNQFLGIVLILLGAYAFHIKGHDFLSPFKSFKKSKYIHYMFFSAVFYSITALADRFILTTYDMTPLAYLAFAHVFLALNMVLFITYFYNGFEDIKEGFQKAGKWILLVSLLTISYRLSQLQAIKLAYIALVVAVKRVSILLTVLIGGAIFHEHHLVKKVIWSCVMVGGVILLSF